MNPLLSQVMGFSMAQPVAQQPVQVAGLQGSKIAKDLLKDRRSSFVRILTALFESLWLEHWWFGNRGLFGPNVSNLYSLKVCVISSRSHFPSPSSHTQKCVLFLANARLYLTLLVFFGVKKSCFFCVSKGLCIGHFVEGDFFVEGWRAKRSKLFFPPGNPLFAIPTRFF